MTTSSRARLTADARARGKIRRQRRIYAAKTPYDRPTQPPTPPPENSNWLMGLIFPTTRMIASGARKLLSSVLGPESWSSSTSSSSSNSESDSSSEDGVNGDNAGYDITSDGFGRLTKKNGTSSEMITCFKKELQLSVRKSETKRVIEQLLLKEAFSREECNRLIEIINSRVVDCSTIKEGQDAGLSEIPSGRVGDDTPDLYSKALMEAKKWLEEKKVGSSSKSDLDHGTCAFNSVVLQHVTEGELGSPLDVAKSYMRARPPWASPSLRRIASRTPSPMFIEHFKDQTPFSVGSSSFSSAQKRDYLSAGSWNIHEEIRRVHSKATEDMLCALPSTKIDLASFALEPQPTQNSLVADKTVGGKSIGDKIHESISLAATKPMDISMNLASGVSTCDGFPGPTSLEMTHDGSQNEVLPSNPALFVSDPNQDSKSIQIDDAGGHASNSHHSLNPELSSNQHTATDPRSSVRNISTMKEVTEFNGAPSANGLLSSKSSLSAGLDIEENPRQSDEENPNPICSDHDKVTNTIPVEETCELLSEAFIEVPVVNETDGVANGSPHSSSTRHEDLSQEQTRVHLEHGLVGKTGSVVGKQQGKRPSRYQRKGRGRSK